MKGGSRKPPQNVSDAGFAIDLGAHRLKRGDVAIDGAQRHPGFAGERIAGNRMRVPPQHLHEVEEPETFGHECSLVQIMPKVVGSVSSRCHGIATSAFPPILRPLSRPPSMGSPP